MLHRHNLVLLEEEKNAQIAWNDVEEDVKESEANFNLKGPDNSVEGVRKELFYSMIAAFTTAIDERTPYNADHTKRIAQYTEQMLKYLNQQHELGNTELFFDENRKEQMIMAAWLHDIGKIVIPLRVMNKATRLGKVGIENLQKHFQWIDALQKIDWLEGRIMEAEYLKEKNYRQDALKFMRRVDTAKHLSEPTLEKIEELSNRYYVAQNGEKIYYLTETETNNLKILRGTLTVKEREIMKEHVIVTGKLLEQIQFGDRYKDVMRVAVSHHEFLDGTGYPKHLTAKELPKDERILPILDIYDSLISEDRPYKGPMKVEEALEVLNDMAQKGKLDRELVDFWIKYVKD